MSVGYKQAVAELRAGVADLLIQDKDIGLNTDFDYLRWLQGFNFDMEESTERLRFAMKYRYASRHDQPSFQPEPILQRYWYGIYPEHGCVSKDGDLLFYEDIMKLRIDYGILDVDASWAGYHEFRCWFLDKVSWRITQREAETGSQAWGHLIWDWKQLQLNLDLARLGLNYLRPHILWSQKYAAELFRVVTIINAPASVVQIAKILLPFFPARTREKVKILGCDWQDDILKDFDPSQLPEELGGSRKLSSSEIFGTLNKFEPDFAIKAKQHIDKLDFSDFTTVIISAGKMLCATFDVISTDRTVIRWAIIYDGAIDFVVIRQNSDDQQSQMNVEEEEWVYPFNSPLPMSHMKPERGKVTVSKPGKYTVVVKNPNSNWFFSKLTIKLKVTSTTSDGEEIQAEYIVS